VSEQWLWAFTLKVFSFAQLHYIVFVNFVAHPFFPFLGGRSFWRISQISSSLYVDTTYKYCPGTKLQAGLVTSKELLCVQRTGILVEKEHKVYVVPPCALSPLWQREVFISCGGKFWTVSQNFAAAYGFSDMYSYLECL